MRRTTSYSEGLRGTRSVRSTRSEYSESRGASKERRSMSCGDQELDEARGHVVLRLREVNMQLLRLRASSTARVKDPQFQTLVISTASGACALSCVGGAFGLASGVVVGAAGGLAPALFTLGMSIPAGAALGGSAGLFLGATSGALGGGVAGYEAYVYRAELRGGVLRVRTRALDAAGHAGVKARTLALSTAKRLAAGRDEAHKAVTCAGARAVAIGGDPAVQVTSGAAAVGGVVGGCVGSTVGTVVGAAVGLVPAVFTLGLSIPVGATVGFCAGTVAGGTAGTLGGAAIGYGGFTHRRQLNDGARGAWGKVCTSAGYARSKAMDSATQVKESVMSLVGGSTGGTS